MSKKFTKEQIIERFNKVHNGKYSYVKFTEYSSQKLSVIVICPIHGEFTLGIQKHLQGQGCSKCSGRGRNTADIIKEFTKIHGDRYDYSKLKFVNPYKHMTIICREHGEFEQTYHQHTKQTTKHHCQKCKAEAYSLQIEDIIERFQNVHGDRYDYSKVDKTKTIQQEVEIICREHGIFSQRIDNHFAGKGCPKCFSTMSKMEKDVFDFVKTLDEDVLSGDKTMMGKKEIDILSHKFKIGIEFNGLRWHSNDHTKIDNRHLTKTNLIEEAGYQLIHIYEDDWLFKQSIVKSRLSNLFHKNKKIFARKTIIKTMTPFDAKQFFENNHLQGHVQCSNYYGLYVNNECFAAMSFSKRSILGNTETELVRFAIKKNYNVIGGASKLLKHFIKVHQPNEIISFADRSWSTGKLYENLGFSMVHKTKPNYYYVYAQKRYNRYDFQKHKLVKKGFDASKTEKQIMIDRGFTILYDSGSIKFSLKLS